MANTIPHPRNEAHRSRGPARRAQGLDPEITAQPRLVSADLAMEESGLEDGLSVDPEDLGSHFLSEAVEQGGYSSESAHADASLFEPPSSDNALVSPNFEPNRSIWEQTVDLSLQTGNDARALRGPGFVPSDDFDERSRTAVEEMKTAPIDYATSDIRELSLFDREGNEGDETIAPDIDTEDDAPPPREESRIRAERAETMRAIASANSRLPIAQLDAARSWFQGLTRRALVGTAGMLRTLAGRLTPGSKRSTAVPQRRPAPDRADEPSIPHLPIG